MSRYQPQRSHLTEHPQRQMSLRSRSTPLSIAAAQCSRPKNLTASPKVESMLPSTLASWDIPHLTKTPWEADRHKKRASWRKSVKVEHQFPAQIFKNLPREVYDCILAQLEQIHLGQDQPCPNCYLADLANLSLVNRAWDKATTSPM